MIAGLPLSLHRQKGCIHTDAGECFRTLIATSFPSEVDAGWLQALYREPVDVTLHYAPIPNDVAAERIGKAHERHAISLMGKSARSLKTHQRVGVEGAVEDTLQVVRDLVSNRTRMDDMALYIRVRAATHDEGDRIAERIGALIRGKTLGTRQEMVRLEEGYFQALPLGIDLLDGGHTVPSNYAAATFPFATGESQSDDSGVLAGLAVNTGTPILVDAFHITPEIVNGHKITLGQSGSGKSHALGLEIARLACALVPVEQHIIDLQTEYIDLCASLGGWIVTDPDDESQYPPPGSGALICYVVDPTLPAPRKADMMHRVLAAVWTRCVSTPGQRKHVVVDEAWEWLRNDQALAYLIWRIAKEGRKYGVALTTSTQQVSDISKGDKAGGENVLSNAETVLIFLHKTNALSALAEVVEMSDGELDFVKTAQRGEALLIRGRNRTAIRVVGSEYENRIVGESLARRTQAVA